MRVYGQSFEYWNRTLTFPLWLKMQDEMLDRPTVDELARWYLQYKRPPKEKPKLLPKLPEYEP